MTTLVKKPVGRPSKYDPSYCDQAIEWGKQGYSREMIAAELDVAWTTLLGWTETNPDFQAALEKAKTLEMAFFEKVALNHMIEKPQGDRLNSALWSRSMAARFPTKYRENSKLEVTGKNDGAVQVDVMHDFAQSLMDDLLASRQNDVKNS